MIKTRTLLIITVILFSCLSNSYICISKTRNLQEAEANNQTSATVVANEDTTATTTTEETKTSEESAAPTATTTTTSATTTTEETAATTSATTTTEESKTTQEDIIKTEELKKCNNEPVKEWDNIKEKCKCYYDLYKNMHVDIQKAIIANLTVETNNEVNSCKYSDKFLLDDEKVKAALQELQKNFIENAKIEFNANVQSTTDALVLGADAESNISTEFFEKQADNSFSLVKLAKESVDHIIENLKHLHTKYEDLCKVSINAFPTDKSFIQIAENKASSKSYINKGLVSKVNQLVFNDDKKGKSKCKTNKAAERINEKKNKKKEEVKEKLKVCDSKTDKEEKKCCKEVLKLNASAEFNYAKAKLTICKTLEKKEDVKASKEKKIKEMKIDLEKINKEKKEVKDKKKLELIKIKEDKKKAADKTSSESSSQSSSQSSSESSSQSSSQSSSSADSSKSIEVEGKTETEINAETASSSASASIEVSVQASVDANTLLRFLQTDNATEATSISEAISTTSSEENATSEQSDQTEVDENSNIENIKNGLCSGDDYDYFVSTLQTIQESIVSTEGINENSISVVAELLASLDEYQIVPYGKGIRKLNAYTETNFTASKNKEEESNEINYTIKVSKRAMYVKQDGIRVSGVIVKEDGTKFDVFNKAVLSICKCIKDEANCGCLCPPNRGQSKKLLRACEYIEKMEAEDNMKKSCPKPAFPSCNISEDIDPECLEQEKSETQIVEEQKSEEAPAQETIVVEEQKSEEAPTEEKTESVIVQDQSARYLQENNYNSENAGIDDKNYNVGGSTPESKASAEDQQTLVAQKAGEEEAEAEVQAEEEKTNETQKKDDSTVAQEEKKVSSSKYLVSGISVLFIITSLLI